MISGITALGIIFGLIVVGCIWVSKTHELNETGDTIMFITLLIFGVLFLVFGVMAVIRVPDNKSDVEYFKRMQTTVDQMVANDSTKTLSIALNNEVLNLNSDLVNRQCSIHAWGFFSYYYNSGYENLKPIIVHNIKPE